MVGGGTHRVEDRFVSDALVVIVTLTLHQQLLSLNLSNNKLYGLDGLSDIIDMAPTVKILNLSKNEVGRGNQIKFGVDSGWYCSSE